MRLHFLYLVIFSFVQLPATAKNPFMVLCWDYPLLPTETSGELAIDPREKGNTYWACVETPDLPTGGCVCTIDGLLECHPRGFRPALVGTAYKSICEQKCACYPRKDDWARNAERMKRAADRLRGVSGRVKTSWTSRARKGSSSKDLGTSDGTTSRRNCAWGAECSSTLDCTRKGATCGDWICGAQQVGSGRTRSNQGTSLGLGSGLYTESATFLGGCMPNMLRKRDEIATPCACNATYVSHTCCLAGNGIVHEGPEAKLGWLVDQG